MYSKIIQLRLRGAARSDREIANDPGVFGVIEMVKVGGYLRMLVREHGNHLAEGLLLPPLWDAKCCGWLGTGMNWQGYQQFQLPEKKGQPVYFQEWRLEIIGGRPPDHLMKSVFRSYNPDLATPHVGAASALPAPGRSR